jgi:hypothetical protein
VKTTARPLRSLEQRLSAGKQRRRAKRIARRIERDPAKLHAFKFMCAQMSQFHQEVRRFKLSRWIKWLGRPEGDESPNPGL